MNRALKLLLSVMMIYTAEASYQTTYYHNIDGLPFDQKTITEFQLASSLAQYSEEDKVVIKPYTQARIKHLFDQLESGDTFVAITTTADGALAGISWIRLENQNTLNMRQTNCNDSTLYLLQARHFLEQFAEVKRLTFKMPLQRLLLLEKIMGEVKPKEIEPYEDDDGEISKDLVFKYFELNRETLGL